MPKISNDPIKPANLPSSKQDLGASQNVSQIHQEPEFKRSGPYYITESSLEKYRALLQAKVLPINPFPSPIPKFMSSSFDINSEDRYVYIGMHHTFFHCIDDPLAVKLEHQIIRGPEDAPKGRGKLNSIFSHGFHPTPFKTRNLLYGPGVYLTQRPAVGILAAAGGLLNLPNDQWEGAPWEVVQIHVFVPLRRYKSWKKIVVKPIPDGGGTFTEGSDIERIRREDMLDGAERAKYGLEDNDVVVAKEKCLPPAKDDAGGLAVEEIAVSESALKGAKFLAEAIPSKKEILEYLRYRERERHAERLEGVEWSEVAVPILELGMGGVGPVKSTETYDDLNQFMADFEDVKDKADTHRYWKAFENMRDRHYVPPQSRTSTQRDENSNSTF